MVEINTGTAETAVDLTNYVPKGEFEKIQAQANESAKGLESLKNQLLDKDYLEYLEARKSGNQQRQPQQQQALNKIDIKNLDMDSLVKLIQEHSLAVVSQAVGPQLQNLRGALTDVQAVLELDQVRGRYDDFDDYAKDVTSILERTQNDLTIEQAYLMVKGQSPAKDIDSGNNQQIKNAGSRNERPGSVVPLDGDTIKVFKNSNDAAQAAAAEVLARHGLSGDQI